jgi:hypothetical protein
MLSACYSRQILMTLGISRYILENIKISDFTQIRPVGAELFLTDGRTDMTKLIIDFRNFAKRT